MAWVTFSCVLFLPPSAIVFIAGERSRAGSLLPFSAFFTLAELAGRGSALPCTLPCPDTQMEVEGRFRPWSSLEGQS